jgi:CheY-like chemotaxis protein
MKSDQAFSSNTMPFRILLADDDEDDHFFFEDVLTKFKFAKEIEIVEDGEKLLAHLLQGKGKLPDVLFLDYNIPRRNGEECLIEIKKDPVLKDLPVIIYSTYLHEDVADTLYKHGAHFFVRKTDSKSLEKILHKVFTLLMVEKAARPERAEFIITA